MPCFAGFNHWSLISQAKLHPVHLMPFAPTSGSLLSFFFGLGSGAAGPWVIGAVPRLVSKAHDSDALPA